MTECNFEKKYFFNLAIREFCDQQCAGPVKWYDLCISDPANILGVEIDGCTRLGQDGAMQGDQDGYKYYILQYAGFKC